MSTASETLPVPGALPMPGARPMPGASTVIERVFRMGSIELPDLAPELEPLKALRLYVQQWPHLRRATLAEPIIEGNRAIYEVEKAPVQTKG